MYINPNTTNYNTTLLFASICNNLFAKTHPNIHTISTYVSSELNLLVCKSLTVTCPDGGKPKFAPTSSQRTQKWITLVLSTTSSAAASGMWKEGLEDSGPFDEPYWREDSHVIDCQVASDTWAPLGMHLDTCHAALRGDSWRFFPSCSILDSTASHLTLKGLLLQIECLHWIQFNKCPTPVTASGKLLVYTPFDYC